MENLFLTTIFETKPYIRSKNGEIIKLMRDTEEIGNLTLCLGYTEKKYDGAIKLFASDPLTDIFQTIKPIMNGWAEYFGRGIRVVKTFHTPKKVMK